VSCVVVFGREPVVGRVKTRLAVEIGFEAAARVYRVLLGHTVEQAVAGGAVHAVLSLSDHPSDGWSPANHIAVEIQPEGSLGDRLAATFRRRFDEGFDRVVVVGSDCARLSSACLAAGLEALRDRPVVLGPADDGGYWLVGQRRPGVDLFSGIPWSSAGTLAATRRRLRRLGSAWSELHRLRDIDDRSDLESELASGTLAPGLAERLAEAMGDTS